MNLRRSSGYSARFCARSAGLIARSSRNASAGLLEPGNTGVFDCVVVEPVAPGNPVGAWAMAFAWKTKDAVRSATLQQPAIHLEYRGGQAMASSPESGNQLT